MAKNTFHGLLPPDDPIYTSGPVIGGKRFYGLSKTGKAASPPKASSSPNPSGKLTCKDHPTKEEK